MKEKDAPIELCLEVLHRLDKAGVLQDIILVGSWCVYFYREYFGGEAKLSALRTRDIDFLIRTPPKIKANVRMAELLKDLGFIPDISGEGYVRLSHPELIIDFLVAEKGRGSDKPYPVKALGIRAQPLRFVSLLSDDTIVVNNHGMDLVLPHPINYALQKLIISNRRVKKDKQAKDRLQAVEVLREVIERGGAGKARIKFQSLPVGWRKAASQSLKTIDAADIREVLHENEN
jgi:hypothetical protein